MPSNFAVSPKQTRSEGPNRTSGLVILDVERSLSEHTGDVRTRDPVIDDDIYRFFGEIINDGQAFEPSAVFERIADEIG
jgi:hypothetical protein